MGKVHKGYHRIIGVKRDLWRSLSPIPQLEQVPCNRLYRKAPCWVLNIYLQREKLHNHSGQPVPMLCHPLTPSPELRTFNSVQKVTIAVMSWNPIQYPAPIWSSQLGSERSRPQPFSAKGQHAFTGSLEHH